MNKFYIQVNDNEIYSAIEILDQLNDPTWDNRHTKTIHLQNISYEEIIEIFSNPSKWSTIAEWDEIINSETQEIITHREIINNDDFLLSGPITDWRDGTFSIVMGKLTELEEAYLLLYGNQEEMTD